MRYLLPLAFLVLPACQRHAAEPKVTHAWVRLPAVPGQPAAAYFDLAGDDVTEKLVKIESTLVAHIALHETVTGPDGTMTMAPLATVDVPVGGAVRFAPGKRHAMLFGIDKVVVPGTAVPLRFGFASGRTAEAEAKTVAAGDDAPY